MDSDELLLRRVIVLASALVYWAGVLVQARRVRRHIGRSPNLKPRGTKEWILWAGWLLVIAVWLGQPLLLRSDRPLPGAELIPFLAGPTGLIAGLAMMIVGYTGTLWCYAAMGDTWRIGINRRETTPLVTRGPYRRIRHPIYLFQMVMLAGAALHLPTAASLAAIGVHFVCVLIKAVDEESYLLSVHGTEYRDHIRRTGRLWPRLP